MAPRWEPSRSASRCGSARRRSARTSAATRSDAPCSSACGLRCSGSSRTPSGARACGARADACGAAGRTRLTALMNREGKQRVAMNEATFRKVNEGMEVGQDPGGLLTFVCECGRLRCTALLELTRAEYEGVRANPRRFAILDGHEIPDAEEIVERHDRYVVVEKAGAPEAEIVEYTDPRRPLD